MAVPLNAQQVEIAAKHFAKFPNLKICPVCHNTDWHVAGMAASPGSTDGTFQLGMPTLPLVELVCTKCYYVRSFAWSGILHDREIGLV